MMHTRTKGVSNNCLNLSSLKKRISFSLCVGNQLYVSTGNLKKMYLDKEKIKSYIWESFQENIMIEIRECETIALTKIKHFSRFAEWWKMKIQEGKPPEDCLVESTCGMRSVCFGCEWLKARFKFGQKHGELRFQTKTRQEMFYALQDNVIHALF